MVPSELWISAIQRRIPVGLGLLDAVPVRYPITIVSRENRAEGLFEGYCNTLVAVVVLGRVL